MASEIWTVACIVIWIIVILIYIIWKYSMWSQESPEPVLSRQQTVAHPVPVVTAPQVQVIRQDSLPGYNEATQVYVVPTTIPENYPQATDEQRTSKCQTEYIDTSPPPAYTSLEFSEQIR